MKCTRKTFAIMGLVLAFLVTTVGSVWPDGASWRAEGIYAADDTGEADTQEADTGGTTQDEAAVVSDEDAEGDSGSTSSGSSEGSESAKVGDAFALTVGEVELEGDFVLKYSFYNESFGGYAWENFVVEVRNEDYTWFDVRADNYGWLYFPTAGFSTGTESITYGNGAADWDVWTELMQERQECTVYVIRRDTKVTVITQAAGDTFYAVADIEDYEDGCPLIVHLSGEKCYIEEVTYEYWLSSDLSEEELSEWDDVTIPGLLALSNENDEGGASSGSSTTLDGGTSFASTEWWTGVTGMELSSDSNNTTWNYTILVESTTSDFGIEVYNEDGSKYITTLTNGEGWYYGDTFTGNDLVIAGSSISSDLERGEIYYVTVQRQGDDFTVYYMDSSGDILLAFFATDTNMDETALVHFYAEYGTFMVLATVDIGTSITTDEDDNRGSDGDSEDTEDTGDTEDTEEDSQEEDTEDVEEASHDDEDEDDDYDIEDLDDEDEDDDDDEETEEDSYIEVTLEEATYSAQTWWSGASGSESSWVQDAVWVYSVTVDKTYGDDVFSIQIYDADGNTITLNSDGTSGYDGVTGEAIVVSGEAIVLKEGVTYVVVVNREESDFWITFYDEEGNELLCYYAADTDMAETAASRFYAQVGDYTVSAESSGTEEADLPTLEIIESNKSDSNGGSGANASVPKTGDAPLWGWVLLAAAGALLILCADYRRMTQQGGRVDRR